MTEETGVIIAAINGNRALHFLEHPLAGIDNDIWFPIGDTDLLQSVETIMTLNSIANHVVNVNLIRRTSNTSADYKVTYAPYKSKIAS